MKKWKTEFGKKYTDRNALTLEEMDKLYKKNYGITRTKLNNEFLGELDRSVRILEIGSNIGNQLLNLQKIGFKNLYGIEINSYAVEISKLRTKNIDIIQGSVFDIPYKNNYFDVVFTSGVLIHISPKDIKKAMHEMCRCSKKYIWGFEYYSEQYSEVLYRRQRNLLWKTDYPRLYLDFFRSLKPVKIMHVKYLHNENTDVMFLLKKK